MAKQTNLKPGDVITRQQDDGLWSVVKVIAIDLYPDGEATVHSYCYEPTASKPELAMLVDQPVATYHAPIDGASLTPEERWEFIDNIPLQKEDFKGFFAYLKITDFRRYAEATGQNLDALVAQANELHKQAYAAGTNEAYQEAIDLYSQALEIFPSFHEALDNRGLTYMDIGDYAAAQRDFDQSLYINPQGLTAFLSKGECLLNLGERQKAARLYQLGMERFPKQVTLFKTYYDEANSA
ncbi:MAG: tetratricopeptide repeat protein [Chloroflexota bacterium]